VAGDAPAGRIEPLIHHRASWPAALAMLQCIGYRARVMALECAPMSVFLQQPLRAKR
jgi:hypothetical protein